MIKTLRVVLVAGVAIVGSGMIAAAADAARVKGPAAAAPKSYHLDGFRGWAAGYRVVDTGCRPTVSPKLDTCGPNPRALMPRI